MTPADLATTFGELMAGTGGVGGLWRVSPWGQRWARARREFEERLARERQEDVTWRAEVSQNLALMRPIPPDELSPGRPSLPQMVAEIHARVNEELPRNGRPVRSVVDAIGVDVMAVKLDVAEVKVGLAELRTDHDAHLKINHMPHQREPEE